MEKRNYLKPETVNYPILQSESFIAASLEFGDTEVIIPDKDDYNFPCKSADWDNSHHCADGIEGGNKFTQCNYAINGVKYYGALKSPYTFVYKGETITIPANKCMEVVMDGDQVTVRY